MTLADRVTRRVYHTKQLPDPGFIKTIFGSPRMSLLFLPLRLYLGWQWLTFSPPAPPPPPPPPPSSWLDSILPKLGHLDLHIGLASQITLEQIVDQICVLIGVHMPLDQIERAGLT